MNLKQIHKEVKKIEEDLQKIDKELDDLNKQRLKRRKDFNHMLVEEWKCILKSS